MAGDADTVAQILHRQADRRGVHPLLVCDSERISYAEAERRSARLARGLIALGAGKGTRVGLLYPNGAQFVVAMLAGARIGAVVVPFSTLATAPEIGAQLRHSDVEILLATAAHRSHDYVARLADALPDADVESDGPLFSTAAPHLRRLAISHGSDTEQRPRDIDRVCRLADTVDGALLRSLEDDVDGADPLAVIYTSGTTGAPKGAVHTHAALIGHQRNLNEIRGLTEHDTLFCNSPFFWIGGFAFALLATVVAGSTLVCSNAADPAVTLDLIESEKPTITNGFVAGIRHVTRHPSFGDRDFSSARRGNLYPIMAPQVRPADPELRHNMLGMTEAGGVLLISGDESDQPEHRRGSFGKPAPGFEVMVVETETGKPVPQGQSGELCIRGPYVMAGYHKRSREECFDPDGWFHTGDVVRVDAEGFVYFAGRVDAMIKTSGANVSAAEVEKAIVAVTGGAEAHVLGIPDAERGQLVAAVVVCDDGARDHFDEAALRAALATTLSAYKIPRRFAVLARSELPLLASGKPDTRRLEAVFDA